MLSILIIYLSINQVIIFNQLNKEHIYIYIYICVCV